MKQKLFVAISGIVFGAFAFVFFALAIITSVSGNELSDTQKPTLWLVSAIILGGAIIILLSIVILQFLAARYYGLYRHRIELNLGKSLLVAFAIFVLLMVLVTDRTYGARLAVPLWISMVAMCWVTYFSNRTSIRLYFHY